MQRLAVVLILAACLVAALYWSQGRTPPDVVSGYIEADEIRLVSRVGGRVERVHVTEGQRVTAGQALVELEALDLEQKRAQAVAIVAASEAELGRLQAGFRREEIEQAEARKAQRRADLDRLVAGARKQEIGAARARVELARAVAKLAEQEAARARALHAKAVGSQEVVDRRATEVRVAGATLDLREQELALLERGTRAEDLARARALLAEADAACKLVKAGYRREEIVAAQAQLASAKAGQEAIERRIAELVIRSPLDGVIESMDLRPGDFVARDAPVIALIDPARLWVRAYVPEDRLDVRLEQAVDIAVDAFKSRRFHGRIRFIAHRAEFTPRNVQTPEERSKQVFRIKVDLLDGEDRLRPGMAADIWLSHD